MLSLQTLTEAFESLEQVTRVEDTFHLGGVPITVRTLADREEIEVLHYAQIATEDGGSIQDDPVVQQDFMQRYRVATLAYAIVQLGDIDLRTPYVEVESTVNGKPVRRERHEVVRELLGRFSSAHSLRIFQRYGELMGQLAIDAVTEIKLDPVDYDLAIAYYEQQIEELTELKKLQHQSKLDERTKMLRQVLDDTDRRLQGKPRLEPPETPYKPEDHPAAQQQAPVASQEPPQAPPEPEPVQHPDQGPPPANAPTAAHEAYWRERAQREAHAVHQERARQMADEPPERRYTRAELEQLLAERTQELQEAGLARQRQEARRTASEGTFGSGDFQADAEEHMQRVIQTLGHVPGTKQEQEAALGGPQAGTTKDQNHHLNVPHQPLTSRDRELAVARRKARLDQQAPQATPGPRVPLKRYGRAPHVQAARAQDNLANDVQTEEYIKGPDGRMVPLVRGERAELSPRNRGRHVSPTGQAIADHVQSNEAKPDASVNPNYKPVDPNAFRKPKHRGR